MLYILQIIKGITAENIAQRWKTFRHVQGVFVLCSQQLMHQAQESQYFAEEIALITLNMYR
ncbi:MAG: hypothetical protein HRT36_04200 [Alphaproteobacteria bacterium]|nr:hypothetical protein [Alphaproteobacteria bacterium]